MGRDSARPIFFNIAGMICRDESLNADAKAKSMKYLLSRKKTEPRYNAALLLLTLLRNKGLWHSPGINRFPFSEYPIQHELYL